MQSTNVRHLSDHRNITAATRRVAASRHETTPWSCSFFSVATPSDPFSHPFFVVVVTPLSSRRHQPPPVRLQNGLAQIVFVLHGASATTCSDACFTATCAVEAVRALPALRLHARRRSFCV